MFSELITVSLTLIVLTMIDKLSSTVGIFLCGILTYLCATSCLRALNVYEADDIESRRNYLNRYIITLGRFYHRLVCSIDCKYLFLKAKAFFLFVKKSVGHFSGTNEYRNSAETLQESHTFSSDDKQAVHCGEACSVDSELKIVVDLILKEYIQSWYSKISQSEDFIREVHYIIGDTLTALCNGISKVDRKHILSNVLELYLHFFSHFGDALNKVECEKTILETCLKKKKEILQNFEMKHWAMKDSLTEWCYLQSVMSALIDCFGPIELLSCPLLHTVVIEILTQNVMYPLVNTLTESDRLNSWVLKLLQNSLNTAKCETIVYYERSANKITEGTSAVNLVNPPEIEKSPECVSKPRILLSEDIYFDESEGMNFNSRHSSSYLEDLPDVSNNSLKFNESSMEKASDVSSELSGYERTNSFQNDMSSDAFCENNEANKNFLDFPPVTTKAHSNVNLSGDDYEDTVNETRRYSGEDFLDVAKIKRSRSADYIRQMPHMSGLLPLNTRNPSIRLHGRNNKTFVQFNSECTAFNDIELAEEAIEREVPQLFTNVQIIDTQHVEAAHAPYTLYCIQYSGIFHDVTSNSSVPDLVRQVVHIKRRFREFLALQSRLEDNLSMKTHLKGIKGPSKWLASPFGNLDKKNVAERKLFLESYLQELCNQDAIAKSTELQEFLAYGGDARIAFVKKAPDINVPRIDKMIFRGVKGAIDLFRTALPNSPSEAGISKEISSNTSESLTPDINTESKFQVYLVDFSRHSPEIVEHIINYFKYFDENSSTESLYDDWMTLEGAGSSSKRPSLLSYGHHVNDHEGCSCFDTITIADSLTEENMVANSTVDLVIELLRKSYPGMKTAFPISLFKHLCGPFLNKFIETKLDDISQEKCASLLHMFHKSLWPEERLPQKKVDQNQNLATVLNDSIKRHLEVLFATKCFAKLSYVMGSLNFCDSIEMLLGSFQHQTLNRCLLFYIFDVIIQSLCSKE